MTDLPEGQLAFLSHIRAYEEAHPGTRFLQKKLGSAGNMNSSTQGDRRRYRIDLWHEEPSGRLGS